MFAKFNPAAAGLGAVMMALAFVGSSQGFAQIAPGLDGATLYSTTCGAGTVEKCGESPTITCDYNLHFSYQPLTGGITVTASQTNCRTTGTIPIYKDKMGTSLQSGACNFLAPFLGMPAGTGCSDEE